MQMGSAAGATRSTATRRKVVTRHMVTTSTATRKREKGTLTMEATLRMVRRKVATRSTVTLSMVTRKAATKSMVTQSTAKAATSTMATAVAATRSMVAMLKRVTHTERGCQGSIEAALERAASSKLSSPGRQQRCIDTQFVDGMHSDFVVHSRWAVSQLERSFQ
mmetsp:Transcript_57863/g.137756  ORF Transcript_57863/g.137756 Transcript_57863/m.137756 type:complete len:164 (-) Transcript_57863:34-525(-)